MLGTIDTINYSEIIVISIIFFLSVENKNQKLKIRFFENSGSM